MSDPKESAAVEVQAPLSDPDATAPDTYVLKFPVTFGTETIESLALKPTGKAMQGFKVETSGSGGVVFEAYRFAELGLKLAGKARAIVDLMHPCDQFGLGMVALGFFTAGPRTGRSSSP